MKRITAWLLLAALILSGCGSGAKPYVPTGDGLYQETTPTITHTQPAMTEQVLTLGYNPDNALNPYAATDITNRLLFSLLYQGLFAVDMRYNVTPMLCKTYSISRDMKTYVFYLEDATFSDGSPLTAADVVASLNAARKSAVYAGRFGSVSNITAQADGGVQIDLTIPYENFPILLDVPIVKAAHIHADWPLGTGPYYKEDATIGTRLVRRTDWWCSAKLAVTASSIGLLEVDSTATLRDDFEFGNIGLVCADPGTDSYVDYRCDYELWDCESGVFLYLACNDGKGKVFANASLRAALTYAIDRSRLVNDFYGGFAISATLPASPDSPYYDHKLAAQYEYNPEVFQQMVQQAAPKNTNIQLLVNSADSRRIRVAKQIGKMLEAGGFTVTVSALSGNAYSTALKKGNYDLHLGQTKLSPNMDLSAFFDPKGALNYGGLSDAAIYALCQEAMANSGNYYTLHQKLMNDGMLCPILFRSYAIYAQRGAFSELFPARDNLFYYTLGKTMEDARIAP